jgi:hypothetical protein
MDKPYETSPENGTSRMNNVHIQCHEIREAGTMAPSWWVSSIHPYSFWLSLIWQDNLPKVLQGGYPHCGFSLQLHCWSVPRNGIIMSWSSTQIRGEQVPYRQTITGNPTRSLRAHWVVGHKVVMKRRRQSRWKAVITGWSGNDGSRKRRDGDDKEHREQALMCILMSSSIRQYAAWENMYMVRWEVGCSVSVILESEIGRIRTWGNVPVHRWCRNRRYLLVLRGTLLPSVDNWCSMMFTLGSTPSYGRTTNQIWISRTSFRNLICAIFGLLIAI